MYAFNYIFHKFIRVKQKNLRSHPSHDVYFGKPGSTNAENTHSWGQHCTSITSAQNSTSGNISEYLVFYHSGISVTFCYHNLLFCSSHWIPNIQTLDC